MLPITYLLPCPRTELLRRRPGKVTRARSVLRGYRRLPAEAFREAALLDREARLLEELRFLGPALYRRQLEIDAELLDIRDDLERLAWRQRS
jgi:hypothetical protein